MLHLSVDLSSQKNAVAAQEEPHHQDHNHAERAISRIVRGEIRHIKGKQSRAYQPQRCCNNGTPTDPVPSSVVSHAVCTSSKTALARRYLAMISSALAVQTK